MDLENELRQAMAEHVTEVSAPGSLAAEAKHRHHRTVRRRTAIAVGAAGLIVVGIAMVPAYQSLHTQTVGADGKDGGGHSRQTTVTPSVPSPTPKPHSASPGSGSKGSHRVPKPKHPPTGVVPGLGAVKAVLGYVPAGINPQRTCDNSHSGGVATTTCRWSGPAGWIEVRLVHESGLKAPSDLGLAPSVTKSVQINGHQALLSELPSQVMWIERPSLGVWVGVSPSLSDSLPRVAEGVNVT